MTAKKANPRQKSATKSMVELAKFAGVTRQTVWEWSQLSGYPKQPDGSVSFWDLAVWKALRDGTGFGDDDESLGRGDSPALERYRAARASQEEIKLRTMEGQNLPREEVHALLMTVAAVIRQAGDTLQRQCGPEAHEILQHALAEIQRIMLERWADDEPTTAQETEATSAN